MILIYAYINKFKNYTTQEIIFDPRWQINFSNEKLSIQYRGQSSASAVIRGDRKPDNLHILVGKTGSGKTNLLQMIGAKHDVRYHRKWEGEDDSYFLLYSISDTEFFLEICDMEIMQFPKPVERDDSTIPEPIRENARRAGTLRTVRFALEKALKPGETAVRFCAVKEYGYERNLSELKVRDMGLYGRRIRMIRRILRISGVTGSAGQLSLIRGHRSGKSAAISGNILRVWNQGAGNVRFRFCCRRIILRIGIR